MKLLVALTTLSLLTMPTAFAAEKMTLDTKKSKIEFIGTKPGDKHEGGFKKFTCDVSADFENPSASTIALEIDATSIWSDDKKLTNHLKNADFFNIRKHPKIAFKSKKVKVTGEDMSKAEITGEWTMLGKTVEIVIPATVKPTDAGLDMTAEFKIDRTKWGMTYGKGKIDNDVTVKATLVLKR